MILPQDFEQQRRRVSERLDHDEELGHPVFAHILPDVFFRKDNKILEFDSLSSFTTYCSSNLSSYFSSPTKKTN